jgi:hypothetical protein
MFPVLLPVADMIPFAAGSESDIVEPIKTINRDGLPHQHIVGFPITMRPNKIAMLLILLAIIDISTFMVGSVVGHHLTYRAD